MRVYCYCGRVFSNTSAPNDVGFYAYKEKNWKEIKSKGIIDWLYDAKEYIHQYCCPYCNRIHFIRYYLSQKVFCIEDADIKNIDRDICLCQRPLTTDGEINENKYMVYTNIEIDDICELQRFEAKDTPNPKMYAIYCPDCKRIYCFDWDTNEIVRLYRLEILFG